MRALVFDGPRRVVIQDVPDPVPAHGQVLVGMGGSGICGSNLPVWEGRPWFHYPLPPGAPGHEGWGIIARLGAGVADLAVGDHIAVLSQKAFAEFDVADAQQVVRLPDALTRLPFPAEPLACAVNVLRRSAIRPGHKVAVLGIGFLGAVVVRLARLRGADVTAVSRRRFARERAEALGAGATVPMSDVDATVDAAKAVNGGREFDVVVEATGLEAPLQMAGRLTTTRGRLVIAGYHQDGVRQVDLQLWNWRGLDVINAHERDPLVYAEGMREAVRLAARGALPLDLLITHRFPLAAAGEAFRCAADRPDGFLKAVVVTSGV